ncbi:MAG: OmpH family outer membrane protein [Cytophagales bacterium]|nr:OmpH family outer membrane protein [Cytophagales bacterium]
MKSKIFLLFNLLWVIACINAYSQKFGYIDTEFILNKMPEYKKAQGELDKLSAKWQEEIDQMYSDLDKAKLNYKAEEILLTEDMKKERLDSLASKEKKLRDYQKKTFGYEGMVFLKRQELVKPVQDKLYTAVEKIAKKKQLQIIFDKSGDLSMIYTDKKHDYTDYVLEELGLGDPKDVIDNKPKNF